MGKSEAVRVMGKGGCDPRQAEEGSPGACQQPEKELNSHAINDLQK